MMAEPPLFQPAEPHTRLWSAEDPVAVVDRRFILPHPAELVLSKKVMTLDAGEYKITDSDGAVVFRVRGGSGFSFRVKRVLLDAIGIPLLTLRKEAWSSRGRWRAFRGQGSHPDSLIFSVRRSSRFQWTTKLNVYLAHNVAELSPDFHVKGNFSESKCKVYLGNTDTLIAQVHRHFVFQNISLLPKDKYGVTVSSYVDYAFMVALILIFHETNEDD